MTKEQRQALRKQMEGTKTLLDGMKRSSFGNACWWVGPMLELLDDLDAMEAVVVDSHPQCGIVDTEEMRDERSGCNCGRVEYGWEDDGE